MTDDVATPAGGDVSAMTSLDDVTRRPRDIYMPRRRHRRRLRDVTRDGCQGNDDGLAVTHNSSMRDSRIAPTL